MDSNFDAMKLGVEGYHPTNTVLYDDKGMPSFMVRIPKFKISDVITGGSNSTHPAFIVNGVEVPEIYISKYQNIVEDERAYSLPFQDPRVYVTFDQAKNYCENKGKGWHLMTNAEWAAIALWCQKNGYLPRGNTSYGKNHSYAHEHGVVTYSYNDNGTMRDGRVATGSGPVSWTHDNSPDGICDLCGNVWEWSAGFRLKNGQLQVIPDNNAAVAVDQSDTSTLWKAIATNGNLVAPSTSGTLYYDVTNAGDSTQTSHGVGGAPLLNNKREHPQYTGGDVNDYYGETSCTFKSLAAKTGVTIPEIARALGLMPLDGYAGEGNFWLRNYGERLPLRGGTWSDESWAGVFALNLHNARGLSDWNVGFRAAFVSLES